MHLRRTCVTQPTQPNSRNAVVLQEKEIPCKTNVSTHACSFLQILQENKPNPKKPPPSSVTPLPNTDLLKTYLLHPITAAVQDGL